MNRCDTEMFICDSQSDIRCFGGGTGPNPDIAQINQSIQALPSQYLAAPANSQYLPANVQAYENSRPNPAYAPALTAVQQQLASDNSQSQNPLWGGYSPMAFGSNGVMALPTASAPAPAANVSAPPAQQALLSSIFGNGGSNSLSSFAPQSQQAMLASIFGPSKSTKSG